MSRLLKSKEIAPGGQIIEIGCAALWRQNGDFMKRRISLLICISLLLACIAPALVSCGGGTQPSYTGMSAGRTKEAALLMGDAPEEVYLAADNTPKLPQNAQGGVIVGDYDGRISDVSKSDPFGIFEQGGVSNINGMLTDMLQLVDDKKRDICMAVPGKDFYLNVHIDNPDGFEILSFTLNGEKYSSYMFEEGSDLENLVLKVKVPAASGIYEYTIDAIKYVDGEAIKDVRMDGDKTIKIAAGSVNGVAVTAEDVSFSTDKLTLTAILSDPDGLVASSGGFVKAYLFDGKKITGGTPLSAGENELSFEGLEKNTLYQLAVIGCYYDAYLGENTSLDNLPSYIPFSTPWVADYLYQNVFFTDNDVIFSEIEIGKEGIEFSPKISATGCNIVGYELYDYGKSALKSSYSGETTSISGLLSGVPYTLVMNYEVGGKGGCAVISFVTEAKVAPQFFFDGVKAEADSITLTPAIIDEDGTLIAHKAELYRDGVLLSPDEAGGSVYGGLDDLTEYVAKITYTYNLQDGKGEREGVISETLITPPYLAVTDITLVNTEAVMATDSINLQITLDNPRGLTVKSLIISGKNFTVLPMSTPTTVYAYAPEAAGFEGGEVILSVDYVIVDVSGNEFKAPPASSDECPVFVNGNIDLVSVEVTDGDFEEIKWRFPNEESFLRLTFHNPTGYEVYGATVNGTAISQAVMGESADVWYLPLAGIYTGRCEFTLTDFSIRNDHVDTKRLVYANNVASVYTTADSEIHYVDSPDDLEEMTDGYYYKLAGDLDMSGLAHTQRELSGVFDGGGHSITGLLEFGTTHRNEELYYGIFSDANGVIENLSVEGVAYAITLSKIFDTDGVGFGIYYGGLVSRISASNHIVIEDCSVSGSVTLVNNAGGNIYGGGILGYSYGGAEIYGSSSDLDITAEGGVTVVAGIVGAYVGDVAASGCENSGNLTSSGNSTAFAAGILGEGFAKHIEDCENSGKIKAQGLAAGIAIEAMGAVAYCENSGEITSLKGNCAGIVVKASASVIGCKNSGKIVGEGNSAGIVVEANSSILSNKISDCENSGEVSVNATSAKAAGIAVSSTSIDIIDCLNTGRIVAKYYNASGIVDSSQADVENCVNRGEVVSEVYASGIGNHIQTAKNCKNYGKVIGGSYSSGIADNVKNAVSCVNYGEIVGNSYSAGIASYGTNFTECINYGKIRAGHSALGIGVSNSKNGKIYRCVNYGELSSEHAAAGIASSNTQYIEECANYGKIDASYSAAGISLDFTYRILNCANYGNITSGYQAYGLASNATIIESSLNAAEVYASYTSVGAVGVVVESMKGVLNVGSLRDSEMAQEKAALVISASGASVSGSYTLNSYGSGDVRCNESDLSSESFYTVSLGWSSSIWNLSGSRAELVWILRLSAE